jgi:hypothetical protein
MALPTTNIEDDEEWQNDMAAGRRVEMPLGKNSVLALQYFPEFDNISLSVYTENMPGFTIGMPSDDWPAVQDMIAKFIWRGRRQ